MGTVVAVTAQTLQVLQSTFLQCASITAAALFWGQGLRRCRPCHPPRHSRRRIRIV
jgi:hypothetical protein